MVAYFVVLFAADFSAAAQAETDVDGICDAAYVSGTVTSNASDFPRVHGTRVAPSGCVPSARNSPTGSLFAGICVFLTALRR